MHVMNFPQVADDFPIRAHRLHLRSWLQVEPIFAMWKSQRISADEALGDLTHRLGWPAIKQFMDGYTPGDLNGTCQQSYHNAFTKEGPAAI